MFSIKSHWKAVLTVALCLVLIAAGLRLVSHATFQSVNPLKAGFALVGLYILGDEYAIVREGPKTILTKPGGSELRLVKYMADQGFEMTDKMGAALFFEDAVPRRQSINLNTNRFCSRWAWN